MGWLCCENKRMLVCVVFLCSSGSRPGLLMQPIRDADREGRGSQAVGGAAGERSHLSGPEAVPQRDRPPATAQVQTVQITRE